MGLFQKLFPPKKCAVCGTDGSDKMQDVLYCKEHLKSQFRQKLLSYRYPVIVIEPILEKDGHYYPVLVFNVPSDLSQLWGKEAAGEVAAVLNGISKEQCGRCEKRASTAYFTNNIAKEPVEHVLAHLRQYPKSFLCREHGWEKIESIVNGTSRPYGAEGDVGITEPYGTEGGIYASF